MDFDDSGIDSDPIKVDINSSDADSEFLFAHDKNEPIISFSPDRCRFDPPTYAHNDSSILSFADSSLPASRSTNIAPTSSGLAGKTVVVATASTTTGSTGTGTGPGTGSSGTAPLLITSPTASQSQGASNFSTTSDLHRRLEKRIARANSTSSSNSPSNSTPWKTPKQTTTAKNNNTSSTTASHEIPKRVVPAPISSETVAATTSKSNSKTSLVNLNALNDEPPNPNPNPNSNSNSRDFSPTKGATLTLTSVSVTSSTSSMSMSTSATTPATSTATAAAAASSAPGFDSRKVPSLLPPQRMAVPNSNKSSHHPQRHSHQHHHSSNSVNVNEGSSSENKPLVQWDSDESEEELSFFPAPSNKRGVLNDNLSIDNMSLSGEEDDLHLAPPRSLSHTCPCDPRLLFDSSHSNPASSAGPSSAKKHCCIT